MKEAAGNLEFEEAARMRDEIKRLQSVALAVGDDPMARQMDIEATAGSYAGERPFGRAANLPSTRPRKPTDADMGPHNWGGGEARPKGGEDEGAKEGVAFVPGRTDSSTKAISNRGPCCYDSRYNELATASEQTSMTTNPLTAVVQGAAGSRMRFLAGTNPFQREASS